MLVFILIVFSPPQYKIERQVLKTQKLNLSVWHRDTFKRNSFLGEVELDLETWDWDSKQRKQLKWYPLKRKVGPGFLLCALGRCGTWSTGKRLVAFTSQCQCGAQGHLHRELNFLTTFSKESVFKNFVENLDHLMKCLMPVFKVI